MRTLSHMEVVAVQGAGIAELKKKWSDLLAAIGKTVVEVDVVGKPEGSAVVTVTNNLVDVLVNVVWGKKYSAALSSHRVFPGIPSAPDLSRIARRLATYHPPSPKRNQGDQSHSIGGAPLGVPPRRRLGHHPVSSRPRPAPEVALPGRRSGLCSV